MPPWGFDPRSLDAVVKLVTNNSTGPRCPTQAWKVSGSNVGSHITHPSLYVMLDREECTESTDIYSSKDLWQKGKKMTENEQETRLFHLNKMPFTLSLLGTRSGGWMLKGPPAVLS